MATKSKEPMTLVQAVQIVFDALEPFDEAARQRILASVVALFGSKSVTAARELAVGATGRPGPETSLVRSERPISPIELLQEKNATTNVQKIALFAFYRERVEGLARFSKDDLKPLFGKAKQLPPQNFDRDYRKAVSLGWIYDDGAESYLTTKGLEAVEAGFGSAGGRMLAPASAKRSRAKNKRTVKR